MGSVTCVAEQARNRALAALSRTSLVCAIVIVTGVTEVVHVKPVMEAVKRKLRISVNAHTNQAATIASV